MALVPGASSGGVFRRAQEPETLTEETVDRGAAGAFRVIREREIAAEGLARSGVTMDPDGAAKARRISKFTGEPAQSILDRLPSYEAQAKADRAGVLSSQDPVLRWWLADPIRAAASGDDLDTLEKANKQYQDLRKGNWFERTFPGMFMASTDWTALQQRQVSDAYARKAAERKASGAAADGILARAGNMFNQGLAGLESGIFTVSAAVNEATADWRPPFMSDAQYQATRKSQLNTAAELRARAKSSGEAAPIAGATSWEDLKARRSVGALGSFVLEQGASSLPAMAGAAINPFAVATSLAGTIGQERANSDDRENADIADVLKASPFAAASALLDRFGLGKIVKPGASTFGRSIAVAAGVEGGTEFAQGVIEYAGGTVGTKRSFDLATAIDQGFAGAVAGAGIGGGLHAMGAGTRKTVENGVRMVQARAGERLIGKIFSNAEASALRKRDPSLFAEFLQAHAQGTAAENIFVPAEAVRELYQSNGWDWEDPADDHFGSFTPEFQDQMRNGLASGGDVVIPMGQAAAHLAGTPEWEAIASDVRVAPGSFSPRETAAMEEQWSAAIEEMGQAAEASIRADLEAGTPRQAVHDAVFSMAREAGFSINASRAYGELWADRYQTRSERLGNGQDAKQLFEASTAGIRSSLPGSLETYRRGDGLDVLVNAMRNTKGPMAPEGPSLISRIFEAGGVEDPGGDIKSMGGDKYVKGGMFGRPRRTLIRQPSEGVDLLGDMTGNDLTLDAWAERLWDEGYFPDKTERPSITDLLELISEGLADRHTYAVGSSSPAVEANNAIVAAAEDLRQTLFAAGLDPDTATRAEIEQAIAAYEADEGMRGLEQFAGPQSETADLHALQTARDMLEQGRNAELVRQETGWFKGVDGRWRYEISDDKAELDPALLPELGGSEPSWDAESTAGRSPAASNVLLGDLLDHERLYAAYPDLKLVEVRFDSNLDADGSVDAAGLRVSLNPRKMSDAGYLLSVLLHEVQHLIQRREGFARGGNTGMAPQVKEALEQLAYARQGEASHVRRKNAGALEKTEKTRELLGAVYMYETYQMLMRLANSDKPSGQLRHIRGAANWIYSDRIKGKPELQDRATELSRAFYAMPKSHKLRERNVWLRDYAFNLAQLLRDAMPEGAFESFKSDTRQTKSVVKALEREVSKLRETLKPVWIAEQSAKDAAKLREVHQFKTSFEIYQALSGEIEARNTQKRAAMTDEERRDKAPSRTADVPEETAIVIFQDGEISAPLIANMERADPAPAARSLFQGKEKGGPRGRIDFLADNRALITLFDNRDMSTLLHEGGHLWLEELRADAIALQSGKVFGDWETIKAWFKREGIEVTDDGEIPTEAHELWARGMERYFMEGKAPSANLRSAFETFTAWLGKIYRLVSRLNSPIDDKVRAVMDRLIATDNAIGWAIHEADEKALFDAAPAAGMSPQEFAAYRNLLEQSRTEAFDALLYKTMERIRRERTVAYQEERDRVRLELEPEVRARPEFVALDLIRGNGEEYLPLDRLAVIERVGKDVIPALPAGRPGKPSIRSGGASPDLVAERAGFPDGRLMLEALIGVQARHKELVAKGDGRSVFDEALDVATEQAMTERHADIFDSGAIEDEALELIHSDAGAQRLAMEVRQLSRKISEVVQGEAVPAPLDAVNAWAERVVREGKISDHASATAVDRHRRAESKASRAAERAYLEGDFETAFREKQKQMMANALYRASRDAKNAVDVIGRRLDRLAKSRGLKGMDPEYLDRIHELLERYDLRRRSQADLRERESFDKWAKRQEEAGVEVFIPERLTLAGNVNFTKIKYEDLVALDDAVQSLAHLGREKSRLKLDKEERDFNELVGEAEVAAAGLPMRKFSNERNEEPSRIRGLDAMLTKIEFLADQLDGGNPNGVFNRVLVQQATRCANVKEALVRKVIDPLAKLYLDAPKAQQKRWAQRVAVPEFVTINPETKEVVPTSFLRSELIAVALNIGNRSNLEKMLAGETMALPELQRNAHGWTEAKVMAVLNRELVEEDWQFVEAVWKSINQLWPDIVQSEREITGITPEKIEGRTVETPYGPIAGGYYPLVYDPNRSQIAADNSQEDAAKLLGQMGRAVATPKGHTISRTSAALPITFSLERVLFNHVNKVATRIAYGRYVRDALKFIGDSRIRRLVDQHAGLEYHKQLKPWLQRQVNEAALDTNTLASLDRILRQFRVNAQIVWMGFRVTTMLSQIAGWNNSAAQIGPKYLLQGMKETVRNMGEVRDFVFANSPEMAGRAQAFDRDVRTFYEGARKAGRREGKRIVDRIGQVDNALGLDKVRAAAFWGIGMIDVYLVAMPTWIGAYRKGLDEGMTLDQARAYGDKAVRESQGAGRAKDLSAIQDSGEATRVLTLAYSYFNVQYNKQRETIHAARSGDWRRAAVNVFWIMMAGPVAGALLTGDWPDEDDRDIEGWVALAMRKMFFGLWSGIPGVRDVASKWERDFSGKFSGDIQAPFYEAFSQIERPAQEVIRLAKGEEPSDRWLQNTITPIGYFVGLPTGQVGSTAQYLTDVATGSQNPDGAGDVVRGVIKGPQKDQE